MLFDHRGEVLCSDATSLIGTFRSSMRTMLECRSAVHRHIGRIEPDGGDDLVDLAMIVLARILIPRAAVALQQQRRIVGTALRRLLSAWPPAAR